jgi:hypothetical protein
MTDGKFQNFETFFIFFIWGNVMLTFPFFLGSRISVCLDNIDATSLKEKHRMDGLDNNLNLTDWWRRTCSNFFFNRIEHLPASSRKLKCNREDFPLMMKVVTHRWFDCSHPFLFHPSLYYLILKQGDQEAKKKLEKKQKINNFYIKFFLDM